MPRSDTVTDDALFGTAIVMGFLSLLLYLFVIRPRLPNNNNNNTTATAVAGAAAAIGNGRDIIPAATTTTTTAVPVTLEKRPQQQPCSRSPPHLATTPFTNGSNVLSDGLIAFKHTHAAATAATANTATAGLQPQKDLHFKARAKVLSRLLQNVSQQPPAKGSTIVVAVPLADHLDCPKQRQILFLLASYYNLLLILALNDSDDATNFTKQDRCTAIATLRGGASMDESSFYITEQLLPSHRIIISSTVAGRVAFVRQLQRIELVLDFDESIHGLLSRFGHRVIVYPVRKNGGDDDGEEVDASVSKLGQVLEMS